MDWQGFLEFFRFTGRRLKLTFAQILNYPASLAHKGQVDEELAHLRSAIFRSHDTAPLESRVSQNTAGKAGSKNGQEWKGIDEAVSATASASFVSALKSPVEDSGARKEIASTLYTAPQAVRLADGRIASATARVHPCWVGSFSNKRQCQAEKSGYHVQPLAMEADFLCVETNGVQGIVRSTDTSKALLMNPPPQKPSLVRCEEDLLNPGRSSSVQRIGSNASHRMPRMASKASSAVSSVSFNRNTKGQDIAPNTWTDKDENTVRMLRMKKHIQYFGAGVKPEDPANCIPCIDTLLGPGPAFFRRKYLLGTKEHEIRQREEWAGMYRSLAQSPGCVRGLLLQG
jgi:hypothetical protein